MIYLCPGQSGGLWNAGGIINQCYQLAQMLGYRYLADRRLRSYMFKNDDEQQAMYDFVGFHLDVPLITEKPYSSFPRIDLDLAQIVTEETNAEQLRVILEQRAAGHCDVVFRLRNILSGPMAALTRRWVVENRTTPESISFDFRGRYQRAGWQMLSDTDSAGARGRATVCLHVRRGDTAVLFMDDWAIVNRPDLSRTVIKRREYDRRMAFYQGSVGLSTYREILDKIIAIHEPGELEIWVCSDGYPPELFRWLLKHERAAELGLTSWDKLVAFLENYENRDLRQSFPDCNLLIGIDLASTKNTINHFVTDDIIVSGAGGFCRFFVEHFRDPPLLFVDASGDLSKLDRQIMEYWISAHRENKRTGVARRPKVVGPKQIREAIGMPTLLTIRIRSVLSRTIWRYRRPLSVLANRTPGLRRLKTPIKKMLGLR